MKEINKATSILDDYLGLDDYLDCFGDFNKEDPICTNKCALSLRCAIEYDQNTRLEILEDLFAVDVLAATLQ